ncbi:EF-hand calcium-binding domain-containing protein 7-like [Saccostrea echinata]|uniref:EF-hand calcium-binding domain-containing protein 7-like n=1 Tax=Saccostrea echinata TaxID=191078 RepID=UPI002A7FCB8D|nr:EF-hand calcium-binding domain-containing protein 7-like [Saccostrea echinata]
MSRRASRTSLGGDNGEFYLECKAAYLSIYDNIKDEIDSLEDLIQVLQQAGRNPSKRVLSKYWKSDTDHLTFDDFVEICKKEKATTADDLMKAFRKIDINGDGYISLEELYKIMTTKGEKMSRSEVKKMIDEVDENKDGRLDYGEFCKMIMETTEECKKASRRIMEKKEQKRRKEDLTKTSDSRSGSQISVKSAASVKSHSERPMSASSRSNRVAMEEPNVSSEASEPPKEDSAVTQENTGSKVSLRSKDNDQASTKGLGSRVSLKSNKEEDKQKSQGMGSKVSIKEEISESKVEEPGATTQNMGSKVSLRSSREEKKQESQGMGSQVSIKEEISESKAEEPANMGSKVSLKSSKEENQQKSEGMGSQVSIKEEISESKAEEPTSSTQNMGSRTSVKSKEDGTSNTEVTGSTTLLNTKEEKSEAMGSKVSLRSRKDSKADISGSKLSLKSKDGDTVKQETMGSKVSLKSRGESNMGSKVSLKSRGDPNLGSRVSLKSKRDSIAPAETATIREEQDDSEEETPKSVWPTPRARKDSKSVKQINEGSMFGSFASMKSGASLAGSRKSLLSVDDLPKPSPRNRKSKGQAAATLPKLYEPKNLKEWTHTTSKGMFFIDEDTGNLLCHQYDLKLTEETSVWITIEPIKSRCQANVDQIIDTALFILRERPDDDGNVLITFTQHRDSKGKYGVKCSLDAGNYHVIPFTTGSRLKKRESESSNPVKLLQCKEGKHTITKAFRKVLEDVFDLSDLDGNGTMSREEFNWYNIRTSDEEVGDDEWEVVEERLELENGEITKNGFLQLNDLEAEDSNGDEDDMWVTLESLGINKELVMDEACPFLVNVYTEDCDDAEFKVVAIESMMDKLQRPLCQSVMEKGEATKVKGMKDLTMYTYMGDTRASIVLDNKSYSTVRVKLDCSSSQNCLTNRPSLEESFSVKSHSQIIAYHFTPDDEDEEWSVKCTEVIQK